MITKPKIGEPCNHCGLCCLSQVCRNGAFVLGLVHRLGDTVDGPCPAVVKNPDGTYYCGIVLNPNKYIKNKTYPAKVKASSFAFLIGANTGCDELLEDDAPEEERKLDSLAEKLPQDSEWRKKAERAMRIIHG